MSRERARRTSEWWRNPDGWLFALCPTRSLGGVSDTWVVAVLKPLAVDPAATADDWDLHDLRRIRRLDEAKATLKRLLDERGGGIRLEATAQDETLAHILAEPWWRALFRRLIKLLGRHE